MTRTFMSCTRDGPYGIVDVERSCPSTTYFEKIGPVIVTCEHPHSSLTVAVRPAAGPAHSAMRGQIRTRGHLASVGSRRE